MDAAEQQIWSRVFGPAEQQEQSPLGQLAFLCRTSAQVYRGLLPGAQGRRRRLLTALLEEEEANHACLRGLGELMGQPLTEGRERPERGSRGKDLRRCWERSFIALREYIARSALGEFGSVFRQMVARQERCCALLAELLGNDPA